MQYACRLHPIHHRHRIIQNHQIRLSPRHTLQRLKSVRRLHTLHLQPALQIKRKGLPHNRMIVHHQYPAHTLTVSNPATPNHRHKPLHVPTPPFVPLPPQTPVSVSPLALPQRHRNSFLYPPGVFCPRLPLSEVLVFVVGSGSSQSHEDHAAPGPVISSGAERKQTDDAGVDPKITARISRNPQDPHPQLPPKRMKRRAAFSSARRFNSYSFVCTSYLSSVPGVPLLSALPLGRASFRLNNPSPSWIEELHPHRIAVAMQ